MTFDDLQAIQQVAILRDIMLSPEEGLNVDNVDRELYTVPETEYVIDTCFSNTIPDVWVSLKEKTGRLAFENEYKSDKDSIKLNVYQRSKENFAPEESVDKFNLTGDISISKPLEWSLGKVITMLNSFDTLLGHSNDSQEILAEMIRLMPTARALPEELFDKMYIDPEMVMSIKIFTNFLRECVLKSMVRGDIGPVTVPYLDGAFDTSFNMYQKTILSVLIGGDRGDEVSVYISDTRWGVPYTSINMTSRCEYNDIPSTIRSLIESEYEKLETTQETSVMLARFLEYYDKATKQYEGFTKTLDSFNQNTE